MKLKIQDYCIRCGICEDLHGDLFRFNHETDEIPTELEAEAKKAISECAIAAIHLVKDKPYAKYLEVPMEKLSEDLIEEIEDSEGEVEDALELADRAKLMSVESYPAKTGY